MRRSTYFLVLIVFVVAGCQSKEGGFVRKGTLAFDPSITVEEAFGRYPAFLSQPVWRAFKSEFGPRHATVAAPIDINKYNELCKNDQYYMNSKDILASLAVEFEFQEEPGEKFRFFDSKISIQYKNGTNTVSKDDSSLFLRNIYAGSAFGACRHLLPGQPQD